MREFDTGATRDTDEDKLDYEGFLSPLALERYASYLHQHRVQADGKMRDSDNWQKGLPIRECVKSMFRHFIDLWKLNRGYQAIDQKDGHFISMEEALCAIIFNAFSILYTLEKPKHRKIQDCPESCDPKAWKAVKDGDSVPYSTLSYPANGTCAPSTAPPNTPHEAYVKAGKEFMDKKVTMLHDTSPPTQYGGDE